MVTTQKRKTLRQRVQKPVLAATLAAAGVFNMMSAVLAEGAAAGETISNTATATYEDDDGDTINATSNTVEIVVAEVAGLTAVPTGINDTDDGAVEAGDTLEYFFEVTNTGNAATNVFVPGTDNIITQNLDATLVEIGTVAPGPNPGDPDVFTPVQTIDADGDFTTTPIPADGSFIVRVTGTPVATAIAGDEIGVTLGNVPPNDNSADTQNQDYVDNGNIDDLYTQDSDGATAPVNGVREASAQQDIQFASSVNPLALVTALKTSALEINDPSTINDDQITYDLGIRVESDDPTNVFQAAALEGTDVEIDGTDEKVILISDAIPEGTNFESIAPGLPSGWEVIYSITAPAGTDPLDSATVTWTRTAPTDLTTVERIGFINSGSLAPGVEVTGLRFTVNTVPLTADASGRGQVDNIAQAFGETVGGPANGDVIYDESGDQSPNNNTDPSNDGAPGVAGPDGITDGSNYDPDPDNDNDVDTDGVADPDEDGIDAGNNNTGDDGDDGGEVNQIIISPSTDQILNGPDGAPGAVGPTDDDDDFTNNSTPVPAGLEAGDLFDPSGDPVVFTNTVSNPTTGTLSNVTLEPIAPSEAADADEIDPNLAVSQYGEDGDIPDGTIVEITFNGQTAEYTYDSTPDPGDDPFELTAGTPVNVGDILPGAAPIDYTVTVTLPDDTEVLDNIPIPIIAFPDDDPTNSPGFTGESTNNITIDRVYTGFVELLKTARILNNDGTFRFPADGSFVNTFDETVDEQTARPGDQIEYRIEYRNISTPDTGTDNVTLTANDFVLTEDGTGSDAGSPDNNWAETTIHREGATATDGVITYDDADTGTDPDYTSEPADGVKVDVYTNFGETGSEIDVLPGEDGNFTFLREVISEGPTPTP
ncbi:hypothetical protein [cf. Phormidesmis sp. LEGE 11477]|uniref:DUF7925 domain-containing protein n=1 Tax=cf. Phormidesmis sp. LEGE 11477 TaxID=1828680 RepID=UPI00188101D6|nr:hypothetical protein [cf. Phormidesmis sp. LEGE 11477]MBE9064393.1 hypothetical protein [cf. Phormidesmis sp. LEGE 11477]